MALSKEQWEIERRRLRVIFDLISKNIDLLESKLKNSVAQIRDSNKAMWKEGKSFHYDFDDVVENLSLLDNVQSDINRHDNILIQLRKMYLLQKSAYFGRFDFIENGTDELDEIYIGTSTLEDSSSSILIYDWRAAISSMFYECETGPAGFESPAGSIEGNMVLKRQYRIFRDKIESMFNSSIVIEDEILQSILSESKNDRMETIVSSIQKEQNRAIRDEKHRIVYVDGPAGSGKTSIALHRAAWLLYRYRDKISAGNIIVYSPNEIFNDYISNVLPELGEENMRMSTFMKLAKSYLGYDYRYEDNYSQMEMILEDNIASDTEVLKLKGSRGFAEAIKAFVEDIGSGGFPLMEISASGNILAASEELSALFYDDYSIHKISTRLDKLNILLHKRLVYTTRQIRKSYVEAAKRDMNEGKKAAYNAKSIIEELRKQINSLTEPDVRYLYQKFLESYGNDYMVKKFKKTMDTGYIAYEDIAPMIYLKLMMGYSKDFREIKHLIIDEVQDYSYMEMLVFFTFYEKVQMTLLGDANQAINHITDSNDLKESVAGDYYRVRLEKSYRSTQQIARFCNKLIDKTMNYEYVERDGPLPKVTRIRNIKNDIMAILQKLQTGSKSIALITKTFAEAERIHGMLMDDGIQLIRKTDSSFRRGTVVTPSYLAKGLEFDAVIVLSTDKSPFNSDINKKLFYTCCSRALHELHVLYESKPPYESNEF